MPTSGRSSGRRVITPIGQAGRWRRNWRRFRDVCVPISRLAECVAETQADIKAHGFLAPIVGHAGDGNFHVLLLFDDKDPKSVGEAEAFLERLNGRALSMEGTCTGEHGIGQGMISYLRQELASLCRSWGHQGEPRSLGYLQSRQDFSRLTTRPYGLLPRRIELPCGRNQGMALVLGRIW